MKGRTQRGISTLESTNELARVEATLTPVDKTHLLTEPEKPTDICITFSPQETTSPQEDYVDTKTGEIRDCAEKPKKSKKPTKGTTNHDTIQLFCIRIPGQRD